MTIKKTGTNTVSVILEQDPDDERTIQYAIVLMVYGDPDYPFKEQEKMTMRNLIAESVHNDLLPGQQAEVFTMD